MAKYEAGQMWVKGDEWWFVAREKCQVFTLYGCDSRYATVIHADMAEHLDGYTLTNPRGLREAAEKMVAALEIDTPNAICAAAFGIRAALEGGGE